MKSKISLLTVAAVGIVPMVAFADPPDQSTTTTDMPSGTTTTTTTTQSPPVTQPAPGTATQTGTTTTTQAEMPPPAPLPTAEQPTRGGRIPAPVSAFEITGAGGYTQGFGSVQSGVGMPSVARAGIGGDLALAYRINPHWQVSIGGQYMALNDGSRTESTSRGFTGTIAAQYHFAPENRVDPWAEFGVGYRWLWESPANTAADLTVLSQGPQLGRGRFGVDFRLSPDVALGPVIGADANLFLWRDVGVAGADNFALGERSAVSISNPRVSSFVYAGLQGRWDIGGRRTMARSENVAAR